MEEKFKKLLSYLVLSEHNARILHWKIIGISFQQYHDLADELVGIISKAIDVVAEMMISEEIDILNIKEIVEYLENDDDGYYLYDYKKEFADADKTIHKMMTLVQSLITTFESLRNEENDVPESYKSKLDEIIYELRILNNYKNKNRIHTGKTFGGKIL